MRTTAARRLATVGILAALLVGVVAAPAVAHDGWISKGGRAKAGTHTSHAWTDSCDEVADGYSARAWAAAWGDPAGPLSWDPDGAGGQCAHNQIYNGTIWWQHKICVEVVGCSPDPGYVAHA